MKRLILSIVIVASAFNNYAQTMSQYFGTVPSIVSTQSSDGMSSTIQLTGGNYFQKVNLENNNQLRLLEYNSEGDIDKGSYFSKDWTNGAVTTIDNNTYSNNLVFMYDKVQRILYFKNVDSSTIYKVENSNLISFTLVTSQPHVFVRSDFFHGTDKNDFFEVLVLNTDKYSLFKLIKRELSATVQSGAVQAMTGNAANPKYEDIVNYYIYHNGSLTHIDLKKKNFVKGLSEDDAIKSEQYLSKNPGKFNEDYAKNVITWVNN